MSRLFFKFINNYYQRDKNRIGRVFYCRATTNTQANAPVGEVLEKAQKSNECITTPESKIPQYVKVNEFISGVPKATTPAKEGKSSFDDIPGPISLRLISKFWSMFPIMGTELTLSIVQYLLSGGKLFGGVLS